MAEETQLPHIEGRVTIAEVARRSGVSRGIASMALNSKGRMTDETRERVRRVADELGYEANVRARRLRSGRADAVALMSGLPPAILANESRHENFLALAMHAATPLLDAGLSLVIVPPIDHADALSRIDADAVIVVDPRDGDPRLSRIVATDRHLVTVGAVDLDAPHSSIDRGFAGADLIFDHLRAQGARRVTVLLTEERYVSTRGVEAYLSEGVAGPVEVDVIRSPAADGEEGAFEHARAYFAGGARTDALYAPMDALAVGAMRAARDAGLSVPEDILVATNHDGLRAMLSSPPLTAVRGDYPRTGLLAAQMVIELLAGGAPHSALAPSPVLVPRASTRGG